MLRLHTDASRLKASGNAEAAMDAAIFPQSHPEAEATQTSCFDSLSGWETPGRGEHGSYWNHWLSREHRK